MGFSCNMCNAVKNKQVMKQDKRQKDNHSKHTIVQWFGATCTYVHSSTTVEASTIIRLDYNQTNLQSMA